MIKLVTAAALAAFVAGPALAEEIRIPVAGKSQAQLQEEISWAARQVCHKEIETESLRLSSFARCMRATLENTQPQLARLNIR